MRDAGVLNLMGRVIAMRHVYILGGFLVASCLLAILLTRSNFITNMVMTFAIFVPFCLAYATWNYLRAME